MAEHNVSLGFMSYPGMHYKHLRLSQCLQF